MANWTNWGRLEQAIPLDDLPKFHREFLKVVQPEGDWEAAPLRRVQGKVQASLKRLEREGKAKTEGDTLLVAQEVIPEDFQRYADDL